MKTPEETKREQDEAMKQEQRSEEQKRRDEEMRSHAQGCRYRLMAVHVIEGKTLNTGTEIGDGTDYPFDAQPSNQMMGLNHESERRVNEVHQKLYGRDAPWHNNKLLEQQRRLREEEEKQRATEREAEPVSHAQAYEQGKPWGGRENPGPPPPAHTRSPTLSGDTSHAFGPASPDQDIHNPDVQVRTARPLADQQPRGGDKI